MREYEVFEYIKSHKYDLIIEHIKKNICDFDVNIKDINGIYLIYYAVIYNNKILTKFLLDNGAYIDIIDDNNNSLVHIAIKYNYVDIICMLLDYDASNIGKKILSIKNIDKNTPLHYAVLLHNQLIVKKILDYDSNTNDINEQGYNPLHLAVLHNLCDIFDILLPFSHNINTKTYNGETVLHMACYLKNIEIVKKIIKHKDVDFNVQEKNYEFTPIFYCVILNDKNIFDIMINENIHLNYNIQDIYGNTLIHYTIIEKKYKYLKTIIDVMKKNKLYINVNLNLWNIKSKLPLHLLLENYIDDMFEDQEYIIKFILENTNINFQDDQGNSSLHYLCIKNIWKKYKNILSDKKININIINNDKKYPINYILKNDISEFMDVIINSYFNKLIKIPKKWNSDWEILCSDNKNNKNFTKIKKYILDNNDENISIKYDDDTDGNKICKNIIKKYIFSLLNNDNRNIPTYPKNNLNNIIIEKCNTVDTCTFVGLQLDVLFGLIYILQKYKFVASCITNKLFDINNLDNYYKNIGVDINMNKNYIDFEILWINNDVYFPNYFNDTFIIKYNNKDVLYIIAPIGISLKNGNHSNYLIYDKQKNELERFEPHGNRVPLNFDYNSELLDKKIQVRFEKILNKKIIYVCPSEYLPKISLQTFGSIEKKDKIGDPKGFCAMWTLWYTEYRMEYKHINRQRLIYYLINNIKNNNISFKDIIRNHSAKIIKIRDKLLQKSNIDVNDWVNENYSNENHNLFLHNITNIIDDLA
jgi:ankyrin repeat protein